MGLGVKRAREKAGLSAAKLEAKTRELGYPITRGTIAKIEGGHRDGKFDVSEVVILATALGVAPLDILFPPTPNSVEYMPGDPILTRDALLQFSNSLARELARARRELITTFDRLHEEYISTWVKVENQVVPGSRDYVSPLEVRITSLGLTAEELQRNWVELCEVGLAEGDDPRAPDYQPAIETWRQHREQRDG